MPPPGMKKNVKYESTPLDRWLDANGVTTDAFAAAIGVSAVTVHTWRTGSAVPSLIAALRIEKMTNGKVFTSVWLKTTLGKWQYEKMEKASRR